MRCEFLHGYVSAPACSLVRTHLHLKKKKYSKKLLPVDTTNISYPKYNGTEI